ncbi:DUF2905 domain-containing protein [Thiomicrorhabdus sp.]|uniref:DUF2905 domain-containing protein n=1 Tax=Thiomicrorhabdus sp. TaxID=2039724 RepID=UPI00356AF8EA
MARWFILAGIALIGIGLILHFTPWMFNWFGRLPGDINVQTENSRIFIPITSMIIISLVLTVIINLFKH